jgi:hypothetical protein
MATLGPSPEDFLLYSQRRPSPAPGANVLIHKEKV